jgi:very-short-patch-repair endonuclease
MAESKVKIIGENPEEMLGSLFDQCSNNNQICYHLKKNPTLISFLRERTKLDLEPMVLVYHYKEGLTEVPNCLCGEKRKYHCYGYRTTCGRKKCVNIEREKSKKEYCLENYGVECVTQLDSMKEKSKKTMLEKYGVDNITKLPETIRKRKEKNLMKWGVEDPITLKVIRGDCVLRGFKKIEKRLPNSYILNKVYKSDKKSFFYSITCENGHKFDIIKGGFSTRLKKNIEICNQCNTAIGSSGEQSLYEYISSIYDGDISRSNRKLIPPYEIDIVLHDLKICIEFNGDYWHSDKMKDKFYHLNKTIMCSESGYDLLQIREIDWNTKGEEIKRKLFNRINNIYDKNDLCIQGNFLKFDVSWYDSRILEDLDGLEYELIGPNLINTGQFVQWDCGYRLYEIF